MRHERAHGFTLIEVVLAVAVLAILAGIGAPALLGLVERIRLTGAAENLYHDLLLARSEAIRRDRPVTVTFRRDTGGRRWCYALGPDRGCDCLASPDCGLAPGRGAAYHAVTQLRMGSNFRRGTLRFHPPRGTATPGSVWLSAAAGRIEIKVSSLGRVRVCAHRLQRYPPCGR